jgi:hypothetical protein
MQSSTNGAVVLGIGLIAAGCAGPRMVPPPDVTQGSQVLEVADRSSMSGALVNESFKLGSLDVADVDRDWNKKSGFAVAGFSSATTTTGYSYKLKGPGVAWEGSCASSAEKKGVAVMGGSVDWGKTKLTCVCKQGSEQASVALNSGSPDSDNSAAGELTVGDTKYRVSPVNDTDKTNLGSGAAGFRFDSADGAVGAVEVLRPGRVWLNSRLPDMEHLAVACVSAGLMLYQPPTEH